MTVQVRTQSSRRFVDWSGYVGWGAFLLVLGAMIASTFFQKTLISTRLAAEEDEATFSKLINFKPGAIGALRVDVRAILPRNRWATYELQIVDANGTVLTSGTKQAWNESGTWYEDGESGTWQEDDLTAGFALKAKDNKAKSIKVGVQVLESGVTSGAETDEPIAFQMDVYDGSIDIRYLWLGFFGTLALAIVTWISSGKSGKKAILKKAPDSDVGDRATLGGENNLIKVRVNVLSDENSPQMLNVALFIKDEVGTPIYQKQTPVRVTLIRDDDGTIDKGKCHFEEYFVITPRASYGFYVEVTPDHSVDQTELQVQDGAKVKRKISYTTIENSI